MTTNTLIAFVIGIICSNISCFLFGLYWERRQWNRLIEQGLLPSPGGSEALEQTQQPRNHIEGVRS
jgi:hypothetical protein